MAEWRGVDLEPLEIAHRVPAKKLGDLVPGVLTGMGIERRRAEAEILKVWNRLIDPDVAAHAQPVGLQRGTLFVKVDSNVWLSEILRYRRKEILNRLQHSFGREMIAKISYRLG